MTCVLISFNFGQIISGAHTQGDELGKKTQLSRTHAPHLLSGTCTGQYTIYGANVETFSWWGVVRSEYFPHIFSCAKPFPCLNVPFASVRLLVCMCAFATSSQRVSVCFLYMHIHEFSAICYFHWVYVGLEHELICVQAKREISKLFALGLNSINVRIQTHAHEQRTQAHAIRHTTLLPLWNAFVQATAFVASY